MSSPAMDSPAALAGNVALITGGGSGIGLGCARALAADGATVVLAGRSAERLADGAAALRSQLGSDAAVHTVVCDVTDEGSVEAACSEAAGLGTFTMVVANAGFGSAGPLHRTTLDEWNAVLATNLTGAFLTIKHAVPHLADAVRAAVAARGDDDALLPPTASIVAISSIAGAVTHRYMTPYNVSKAGLEMLVRQSADELGPAGIRANAVRPGLVPTDATEMLMTVPDIHQDYLDQMPLGRVGSTDDVAALVRFLLGPESGWITGTCVSVDGGHHLRRGPDLGGVMRMVLGDDLTP
jgi:NAD(P)-dependent dehydrogenase (short-subunit alcohol dehydrogenase family)